MLFIFGSVLMLVGLLFLVSFLPNDPNVNEMLRGLMGFFLISVAITMFYVSDLWKDNGPMELITILTPGSSYEVISSGELEEGKYWLITRDQDGKVRALTSTEKLPATKKVVVMKEKNTFHLIPYEEPSTDPKGWGAEEAAAKTESEKASEPALPKP